MTVLPTRHVVVRRAIPLTTARVTARIGLRTVAMTSLAAGIALLVAAWSMTVGDAGVPVRDVLSALLGRAEAPDAHRRR